MLRPQSSRKLWLRGNHLFSVKVVLPQKLDANERELLEQLATIAASHPKGKGGLFGGLFQ